MTPYRRSAALITGATGGLGEAFAELLAARGTPLVLTARGVEALEALAARLIERHGVEVTVIPADLARPEAAEALHAEVHARGLRIELLVNVAGFGLKEGFLSHTWADEARQLQVNVSSLVALCHHFGTEMAAAGHGGIINLASVASLYPFPGSAVYGGTKSFVLSFSQALGRELAPGGVHVLAVCPGPVATSFFSRIGARPASWMLDAPDKVVADAMRAYDRRRAVVFPGRVAVPLAAFLSRWLSYGARTRIGAFMVRLVFK